MERARWYAEAFLFAGIAGLWLLGAVCFSVALGSPPG